MDPGVNFDATRSRRWGQGLEKAVGGGGEKGLRQKRNKKWKKIGAESLENRSKKPRMSVTETHDRITWATFWATLALYWGKHLRKGLFLGNLKEFQVDRLTHFWLDVVENDEMWANFSSYLGVFSEARLGIHYLYFRRRGARTSLRDLIKDTLYWDEGNLFWDVAEKKPSTQWDSNP